jgi:REP element-mobilizing transposase RayT
LTLGENSGSLAYMPSRHITKESLPDGIYHLFNRGVERREIFLDQHDYRRFKLQLEQALQAEPAISLWAFCLMPNHFHLLVHQADEQRLGLFMQRLITAYVMYFNKRHKRVGPLFQGKYKAVRIIGPGQLMETSRYIHLNPERAGIGWRQHQHSSITHYLEPNLRIDAGQVDPWPVLKLFDLPGDYQRYLSIAKVRP